MSHLATRTLPSRSSPHVHFASRDEYAPTPFPLRYSDGKLTASNLGRSQTLSSPSTRTDFVQVPYPYSPKRALSTHSASALRPRDLGRETDFVIGTGVMDRGALQQRDEWVEHEVGNEEAVVLEERAEERVSTQHPSKS